MAGRPAGIDTATASGADDDGKTSAAEPVSPLPMASKRPTRTGHTRKNRSSLSLSCPNVARILSSSWVRSSSWFGGDRVAALPCWAHRIVEFL
jgi:hypothetical protein